MKIGICPECHEEQMVIIGTEKFMCDVNEKTNWKIDNQKYMIYVVWYCHNCTILLLREPKLVFG